MKKIIRALSQVFIVLCLLIGIFELGKNLAVKVTAQDSNPDISIGANVPNWSVYTEGENKICFVKHPSE